MDQIAEFQKRGKIEELVEFDERTVCSLTEIPAGHCAIGNFVGMLGLPYY